MVGTLYSFRKVKRNSKNSGARRRGEAGGERGCVVYGGYLKEEGKAGC